MEKQKRVVCSENEELAAFVWNKRQEMADRPKGISENIDMTLYKAYSNVCDSKTPIKTLRDFIQVKGVGKWILRLMQGFFGTDSGASENEELREKGKKIKRTKRYMPKKNSVAYALLITLYRGTASGSDFMRKQDLIDAAEASGLSHASIAPEKGKGKAVQFGSSPRDWYSGWNCMTTLITKGLVLKSSCPAKYMLTEEGKEAARECLLKSGFVDSIENLATVEGFSNLDGSNMSDLEFVCADSVKKLTSPTVGSSKQKKAFDVPPEYLDRFVCMGYSKEQILSAFCEVSEASGNKEISSLWPAVLCHLKEYQVYGCPLDSMNNLKEDSYAALATYKSREGQATVVISENKTMDSACDGALDIPQSSFLTDSTRKCFTLRACSTDHPVHGRGSDGLETKLNILALPPLSFGERFEDAYEVILILDNREQFSRHGSRSGKIIENIRTQFKIQIEVRWLPVGDGIWVARNKHLGSEYVLDFVVERKNVDDLRLSIKDNRYRDQKLRLLRCGLKKLIYLVEGDPNSSEAAESIKTACFTTEILEGFNVQRTSGLADTLRKYGYLTQAITQYYRSLDLGENLKSYGVCPPLDEFIKRCQNLDKMTVSDVFAIQLMQVPQVTEEVAIAVLDIYPTLLSLAQAYSFLEGDISAQEEMLKKQSNNVISGVASKNIFQLVWGS